MKILHSAALLSPSSGMLKQMLWEQEASKNLHYHWNTVMYCPSGDNNTFIPDDLQKICKFDTNIFHSSDTKRIVKIQNWLKLRQNYYKWLALQDCDVYLLRYYVHDYLQYQFIKTIKKPVFLIHHSFEIPELALPNTFSAYIRSCSENFIGKLSLNAAFGLIGVTPEILRYEQNRLGKKAKQTQNCLIYPNGFNFKNHQIPLDNRDSSDINILFLATNFDPWHGLDLLIQELKSTNAHFTIHIVGKISIFEKCELESDTRVRLHTSLTSKEIGDLASICDIGLSSFALMRKNMEQACTLKVREYLSNGLPVYSGHKDIFPDDFIFYKYESLNLERMLTYARSMKKYSRNEIILQSTGYIDKESLVKNLYLSISDLLNLQDN